MRAPSDNVTMKVRYRAGDVMTPEIAVALREQSVVEIVGGAALFTVGALIASASIYGAVTYEPSSSPSTCFVCIDARPQIDEFFAGVGIVVLAAGAALLSIGVVTRASIKSAVQHTSLSRQGIGWSF